MAIACRNAGNPNETSATPPIKNVLLITIDTLRPDALSIYGGRVKTPFFDRFAAHSVVFDNAFSCAPITLPSHTSLLTGLYPPHHGVRNNGTFRAPEKLQLLSETARQNGLRTAAIIGGYPLASQFGLSQGFEKYDDRFSATAETPGTFALAEKNAESVSVAAETWLSKLPSGQRYFLWMHFFDPHHPYLKHGLQADSPYHEEVEYVDQNLAKFFDFLRGRNLERETLIVITADHGEAFGEHGEVSHSLFVYQTTLHIPLLISGPGIAARHQKAMARIIDIAPTIEAALGWKTESKRDGVSLMPLLAGSTASEVENYAETFAPALDFGWSPLQTIHDLHKKYIQAPRPEFYDLDRDPDEENNLANSVDVRSYRAKIASVIETSTRQETRYTPSAEERERLQSLGYFSSPAPKQRRDTPDPKDRVAVAKEIAELTMQPMDLSERAARYKKIAVQDPDNPLLLSRYGEILLQEKEYDAARSVFQHVLDLEYPSPPVYNGMAATLFYLGKPDQAKQVLQQAVKLKIADGETYYNLAEFVFDSGDRQGAMDYYTESLKAGFIPAYFRVARLKEITGDDTGAMALLNLAQEKASDRPDVYYERAIANYRHSRFAAALTDFHRARELSPENTGLLYNIGVTYFRMNDSANTQKYLRQFLQNAPATMQDERREALEILQKE